MTAVLIRPMTAPDVVPAADLLRRGDWGERESFFAFAVERRESEPFVAELDGRIVGTGVASAHGNVGWIGTIFVAADLRGQGIGGRLTARVVEALETRGCRTLVLVATDAGRPVYEKLGFEIRTHYQLFEIEGLAGDGPKKPEANAGRPKAEAEPGASAEAEPGSTTGCALTRFARADLDEAAALDLAATGEQRRDVLETFAGIEGGLALRDERGWLQGFVIRAPWGGGATVATSQEAAIRLLDARRQRSGPDATLRVGVPIENEAGRELLERLGWRPTWQARRMERGPRLDWRPDWLWGQFNMAIG